LEFLSHSKIYANAFCHTLCVTLYMKLLSVLRILCCCFFIRD